VLFVLVLAGLVLGLLGCRRLERSAGTQSTAPSASASAPSAQQVTTSDTPESPAALTDHRPEHRLRWAKALARRADDTDRALLLQLLRDGDPSVVAWAAFGLGRSCAGQESETLRALVTRAASLQFSKQVEDPAAAIDPELALALAISRCPSPKTERTLLASLTSTKPRASAAALGLARLSERQGRLEDDSLVALLNAASRDPEPISQALLAMDRLTAIDTAVAARLTKVGQAVLEKNGSDRPLAILSLGRGDADATSVLAAVAADSSTSNRDRALAVRALGRRGEEGQAALRELLGTLAPKDNGDDKTPWVVVLALLRSLSPPVPDLKPVLEQLTERTASDSAGDGEKHRVTLARCWAATLLAGTKSDGPRLLGCDPDSQGIAGKLALLDVLDRGKINGPREAQWKALAHSESSRVRIAALKLLGSHHEIDAKPALLSQALQDAEPGIVATAAELLATHPEISENVEATAPTIAVDPKVVTALTQAFERDYAPDQIALRAALLNAAASLKLLSLKSKVEASCRDENPTLRKHAKHALEMLGDTISNCDPKKPPPPLAIDGASESAAKRITVVVETTAGEHRLFLRPDLAPLAVGRVVELVRAGFYDKMAIVRAVPGSVVQFGDPKGDGYGGAGRSPVPSEPSPIHFGAFTVGMADAGRDTASSQIFITLVAAPALDGEYTFIGSADKSWQDVVLDDVILRMRVE
jgi:cyclophilin family peptidyl-prolyl cis-trans isomerase